MSVTQINWKAMPVKWVVAIKENMKSIHYEEKLFVTSDSIVQSICLLPTIIFIISIL